MKEKVINILSKSDKALSVEEIIDLCHARVNEIVEIQNILNEFVQNGTLYFTNKGKYILFENCEFIKRGKIQVNQKGFGFLLQENGDIHIDSDKLNGAIDGDTVVVEIIGHAGKSEGRVIRIVERNLNNLVGEVRIVKGKLFLLVKEKKGLKIELERNSAKNCVDGSIVSANIIKEIQKNYYLARVDTVIGHKDDAGVDILEVAYKYEIYPDFNKKTLHEIENIPTVVSEADLIGRRDLTNKMIFTIDGADTKDIDDAISLEKADENYILGVHIADVSYYVKEGTSLNDDAYNRGTSSYLVDTVIPMLPHKLSNGICSLNEGEIRLTETCQMIINQNGKVIDYDIFPSYIKSRKKMTYRNVNDILIRNKVNEGYEEFADILKEMNELAHILRKEKVSRGYIDFELDEAKISCNSDGRAEKIERRIREDGEKMIEDFMIVANETVATAISNLDLPFIYRVHDKPKEEKIEEFIHLVSILGYKVDAKIKNLTPKKMQNVLDSLKNTKEYETLSTTLLRSMKKAKYQVENIGHFGLASECYTHFTSPIRRYPDLIVHRLIRKYLFNNEIDGREISKIESRINITAEWTSDREVKAVEAEREVDDMKMAEYMEGHIGEEFEGKISGLTNFGFFVELDNLIEGLVHISTLKGDYYNYNEDIMAIIGTNSKKMYRLGDNVKVKVVMANKEKRTIDFEIVKEKQENGNSKQKSEI